jgi:RHS repeat-associated protein
VVTKLIGPNGLATKWQYDTFGRKTLEIRADTTYTSWTYQLCTDANASCPAPAAGNLNGQTSVNQVKETNYSGAGIPLSAPKVQFTDAQGRTIRSQTLSFTGQLVGQDYVYDNLGRMVRYSNSYNLNNPNAALWTVNTYDSLVVNRIISISSPGQNATTAVSTMSYNGLTSTTTNSNGQTKITTKNVAGLVEQIIDNNGSTILYRYDPLGQLLQTNAAANTPDNSVTTLEYNQRGQKKHMLDPSMGDWIYEYNIYGELVKQIDSLSKNDATRKTTIKYDPLGRMTKRDEPDLVSEWFFDKTFAGVTCGASGTSIGKLCEAKTGNGYNRKHNYDTLGRATTTTTVLDSASAPAVVTLSYDNSNGTGRLLNKTWPTGYQASYTYTSSGDALGRAPGYMTVVTGAPSTGTAAQIAAQTVRHEILSINDQGQIISYKTGNNPATQVTTRKTIDIATGQLMAQNATTAGQAADSGNIVKQSYTYDSLSNMLSRTDSTVGVGTSENFSYDGLNRLSKSIFSSSAISPPVSTQVIYDARGNIRYKSDVGQFWYDTDRPNRLTQITTGAAAGLSGVTVPVTGTRQLSYAFDDYLPGAKTVMNGSTAIPTGNGNLMYTVSHDTQSGKHTARWETYTSFNMINEIKYGDLSGNTSLTSTSTTVQAPGTAAAATTLAGTPVQKSLSFLYGPEHQRIKQVATGGPDAGSTWYLNGEDSLGLTYEKEQTSAGITEHKHYLQAGGITFAMHTMRVNTANGTIAVPNLPSTPSGNTTASPAAAALSITPYTTSYLHPDHLGSVIAITDNQGAVVERLAYDAWGKRRYPNGTVDTQDALTSLYSDRGFTLHEHLDEMGIIHMNGRVYDPLVGRFMSADPTIPNPFNLQSFNRYSYVRNNPLKLYDPTGYDDGGDDGYSGEDPTYTPPDPITKPDPTVTTTVVDDPVDVAAVVCISVSRCAVPPPVAGVGQRVVYNDQTGEYRVEPIPITPPPLTIQPIIISPVTVVTVITAGWNWVLNVVVGDKHPRTPTGQRGSPIDVTPGTNEPTTIGGREYTGHSLDQMQGRGIPPTAVENAIQNGTKTPGNQPGTTVNTGSGVTVVTGDRGQVITVIPN